MKTKLGLAVAVAVALVAGIASTAQAWVQPPGAAQPNYYVIGPPPGASESACVVSTSNYTGADGAPRSRIFGFNDAASDCTIVCTTGVFFIPGIGLWNGPQRCAFVVGMWAVAASAGPAGSTFFGQHLFAQNLQGAQFSWSVSIL